jgi:integrase
MDTIDSGLKGGKSKRTRHVPVPAYLAEDLRALRQIQSFALRRVPEAGDRVFLSPKHRPLDSHGNPARVLLRRVLERAGIPYRDDRGRVDVDIHALRRTAGTRLLRHSVPLATVAKILGHTDVRLTVKHYEDLRIADTKRAVAGVPEVGGAAREQQPAQARRRLKSASPSVASADRPLFPQIRPHDLPAFG